jgi:FkbH-like protein
MLCHLDVQVSSFDLSDELETRARSARLRDEKSTIAITATFTAEPIEESLAFWMEELGIQSEIKFAPYNQVFQQLLAPSSLLSENQNGVNVIFLRLEDWQRYGVDVSEGSGSDEQVENNVRDIVLAFKSATERSAIPHLLCLCPASSMATADQKRAVFFQQMEEVITCGLKEVSGVYLVTASEILSTYPVEEYSDPYGDEQSHIPYTPAFYAAIGTMVARKINALNNSPYKVIVLDCDQTLWEGVCGEDGAREIRIDPPRSELQKFMVAQHDAGMLLCLCSKNNEEDVIEVFECRSDMCLKREHIISWRHNWKPKSENIRSLAEELKLGLDSFIFIDDNPLECAEVEANCPEVLTLQLPQDVNSISTFLKHIWAFDHLKSTTEDRQRTEFYRQNKKRELACSNSLTFEEFLTSLGLEVRISELVPRNLTRVSELTRRTNQFNLTTIRRSESEIERLCLSAGFECLCVEVRDRFGDYGLVGVMIFEIGSEAIEVDTFLLSCRALGRGVERRMLSRLGEIAIERGLRWVNLQYLPTDKNRLALDVLENIGAQFKEPLGEGSVFRLPADLAAALSPDGFSVDTASNATYTAVD